MPLVTVFRRQSTARLTEAGSFEEQAEVVFSTPALSPRSVYLPLTSYRPATPDELAANPRYTLVPVDQPAQEAERNAIQQAIHEEAVSPPLTFDLQ